MATATSTTGTKGFSGYLHLARNIAIGVFAIGALLIVWNWSSIKGQAGIGAAYGAHIACSCRYIEGRDMASCQSDKESGMELVGFTDDPKNMRVTASVPFLAEAVAERRGSFGCVQLNEAEMDAL